MRSVVTVAWIPRIDKAPRIIPHDRATYLGASEWRLGPERCFRDWKRLSTNTKIPFALSLVEMARRTETYPMIGLKVIYRLTIGVCPQLRADKLDDFEVVLEAPSVLCSPLD